MAVKVGDSLFIPWFIDATDLAAGTTKEVISPVAGYIVGVKSTVQVAIVTGGALTVKRGTDDVAGLSITVADSATKGTIQSATATPGSTTREVAAGGRIQIVPAAAFNGGGALNGFIEIASAVGGEAALT